MAFDELKEADKQARDDLKKLKASKLMVDEFTKELDAAKSAFDSYQLLLQNQGTIQEKVRNDLHKLALLDESWKSQVLEQIKSADPANTTLLQHQKKSRVLKESIEVWRLMETELERELEKAKKEMFVVNKIAGEIRTRLQWQENQKRAGYEIDQDGARF